MFEILLKFEEKAVLLDSIVLIASGIACVILGLFIWLGGFGFRKSLAALVGAAIGGISGYFITGLNTVLTIVFGITAAVIAVVFEDALTSGSFGWRLVSALLCSTLGALLIFTGMILLLIYKGTGPISYISYKVPFFSSVFAAMILFGTIEHLLLCQRIKEKRKKEKSDNRDEESSKKSLSWRNR